WSRPHGSYERTPRGRGRPVPYTASTTRYGWIRTEHGRFGALRRMRAKGRQSRDRRVPSEEMVAESPSPQSPGDTTGQGRLAAFRKAEELVRRRPLDALALLKPLLDSDPDKPSVQLLAGRA